MTDRDLKIGHLRRMLDIHRFNLAHYERQAQLWGGVDLAPPIVGHGIEENRTQIARIERELADLGATQEDQPSDHLR